MKYTVLKNNEKYSKQGYYPEEQLTDLFLKHHRNIISDKSFFIKIEKQIKSGNFKDSIIDGVLLVWNNPTTPTLYLTEVELEKHSIDRHILPQLGDFISFIKNSPVKDIQSIKSALYDEIKKNKHVFDQLKQDTGQEVHALIESAIEDLQILLVIDRISPNLSIGLSTIEKAINVKIRKIEVTLFTKDKEEVLLFTDSEITDEEEEEEVTSQGIPKIEEYTLEYHLENKPEKISSIFNLFLNHLEAKGIKMSPMKHYIGFYKNNSMIFSCVVRKNSLVYYSKAKINEIKSENYTIPFRDVRSIGHYTNHLPTEIVITEAEQIKDLEKYFDEVFKKY